MSKILLGLALLICLLSSLRANYIVLDETESKDIRGNIFYILKVCKDGMQYTAISKTNGVIMVMAQDFITDIQAHKIEGVPCQMDFKTEEQIKKGLR